MNGCIICSVPLFTVVVVAFVAFCHPGQQQLRVPLSAKAFFLLKQDKTIQTSYFLLHRLSDRQKNCLNGPFINLNVLTPLVPFETGLITAN